MTEPGPDPPPPPVVPPSMSPSNPPGLNPPDFQPDPDRSRRGPGNRRGRRAVALKWIVAATGLAIFILIAVEFGLAVAMASVGVAVLLDAVLLLVVGRGLAPMPRYVGSAGSPAGVRVFALGLIVAAAYCFIDARAFQTTTLLPLDAELGLYAAFFACFLAAGFLAWRSVTSNPSHPEHGRRPYFIGGKVPVTPLGAAAASAGLVSVITALLLIGAYVSVPAATIPLGAVAAGLGLVAFVRAGARRPASRAVPVAAILAGVATLGMTAVMASTGAEIQSIACPTLSNCVGVGWAAGGGFVVPVITGTRGSVMSIPGSNTLSSIACPTPTRCIAVGSGSGNDGGVLVTLSRATSRTWAFGPVQQIATVLNGVACPSVSRCVAVGDGAVVIASGDGVSLRRLPHHVTLDAVACPTPTHCEAVGAINPDAGNGPAIWLTINDGVIGPVNRVQGSNALDAIACPSAATCIAVGQGSQSITLSGTIAGGSFTYWGTVGAVVPITNGVAGRAQMMTAITNGGSISCPTQDVCVVAGSATGGSAPAPALVVLNDGRIGAPSSLSGGSMNPEVACDTHACLVTGAPQDEGVTTLPTP